MNNPKPFTYRGRLITLERHNWGILGTVISDSGIYREKLIGHSIKDCREIMREIVRGGKA